MKSIAIILVFILVVTVQGQYEKIIKQVADKYCNTFNVHGQTSCFASQYYKTANSDGNILGGRGWNHVKRDLVAPVLAYSIANVTGTELTFSRYDSVHTYMKEWNSDAFWTHPMAGDTQWVVNTFGDYKAQVYVTRKNWYTHKTVASLGSYQTEYLQFLSYLPKRWDVNNETTRHIYELFFDLFGTHVAYETLLGGSTYQISNVKLCTNVRIENVQELEAHIENKPFTSEYLKYRRHAVLQTWGGNIQVQDMKARSQTFSQAPATLHIKVMSITQVIPDNELIPTVQEAVKWYISRTLSMQQSLITQVEQVRSNRYKEPKNIRLFSQFNSYYRKNEGFAIGGHCPYCYPNDPGWEFGSACIVERANVMVATSQEVKVPIVVMFSTVGEYRIRRDSNGHVQVEVYRNYDNFFPGQKKLEIIAPYFFESHLFVQALEIGLYESTANIIIVDSAYEVVSTPAQYCGLYDRRLEIRCTAY
jgi:hypothetical protein